MKRRRFIEVCSTGISTCGPCISLTDAYALADPMLAARAYAKVKLVDRDRHPIKALSLKANHNYVFNYPYETTPCFLLNLEKPLVDKVSLKNESGKLYEWEGGCGKQKSIVAYSAICAHKLAYPAKQVSFIGFRPSPSPANGRGKVITCCADKSVYDPFAGAKVVSGPAPQPLATILLEHDVKSDELFAIGTLGGEKFNEFFQKYDFKLAMESGDRAKELVTVSTVVSDLANYSAQTAQC